MKSLLIVFHSMTGGTRQLAQAAARGAGATGEVAVNLRHAAQAGAPDLLAADAYLFATPENLAAISGRRTSSTGPTTRRWGASRAGLTRP